MQHFVAALTLACSITATTVNLGCGNTAPAPTKGRIPANAMKADGRIDLELVPDYVMTYGRDGTVVGYVSKTDIIPPTKPDVLTDVPVVDATLQHVVGHMVPGYGFQPIEGQRAARPFGKQTLAHSQSSDETWEQ